MPQTHLVLISKSNFFTLVKKNSKKKELDEFGKRKPVYAQNTKRYRLEVVKITGTTFPYIVELFDNEKVINQSYMRGYSKDLDEAYDFVKKFVEHISA